MFDADLEVTQTLGKDQQTDLEQLILACRKNLKSFDEQMIRKAFQWCVTAHENQLRKSGSPYYTHPLSMAMIITEELPLDDISVTSSLLHEITRHSNKYTIKDIEKEFGTTVAEIVDTVQRIHHVENYNIEEFENYRRLLLSLFKDVRIILIKLADRLHNMRTAQYLSKENQRKIAQETLEIYAPFAHRFGLANIKGELEDQAFKILNYDTYKKIREIVQLSRKDREEYLRKFIKPIKEALDSDPFFKSQNVQYELKGRVKHLYSIYNKSILRNKPVEELYDLFAIRVILNTDNHHLCYIVLSIISDIYETMPGTYKNYIAHPKKNGYQSLHIAFFGEDKKPVEVQIRTKEMHEIAEKGLAAHFKYKHGFLPAQSVLDSESVEDWLDQIHSIFETIGEEKPDKLIQSVKQTLLFDEIYVFTPANEFRVFPKNSTTLDFAYGIHTEIGNKCIGAKVNGRVVPIDYRLQNGDIVEILTSENRHPSAEWLSFIVTQKARSAIQKFLKEEKKRLIQEGRQIWRNALDNNNITLSLKELRDVVEHFNFTHSEEFYLSLANKTLHIEQILAVISQVIDKRDDGKHKYTGSTFPEYININLPVKFAECCYPLPGDRILGEIIPGKEIIVHRHNCNNINELIKSNRNAVIRLAWSKISQDSYTTKLLIRSVNDTNVNKMITKEVLNHKGIKILAIRFDTDNNELLTTLKISINDIDNLNNLITQYKEMTQIKEVDRYIE